MNVPVNFKKIYQKGKLTSILKFAQPRLSVRESANRREGIENSVQVKPAANSHR